MSKLYYGSTLITRFVSITKQINPRKNTWTLLDGTDMVQIVGDVPARFDIEVYVDASGKAMIDEIDSEGDVFTVIDKEGTEYSSRILTKADWTREGPNYFKTKLTVSVEAVS